MRKRTEKRELFYVQTGMMILTWILFLALFSGCESKAASDSSQTEDLSGKTNEEEIVQDILDQMEEELALDEIDETLEQSSLGGDYSFSDLVSSFFHGDTETGLQQIGHLLSEYFWKELKKNRNNLTQIFLISILLAVFSSIAESFQSKAIGETGFFAAYLMLTGLIMSSFFLMSSITGEALKEVLQFMEALIPAYALAVTMVSGSASSIALYEMTLLLIRGCQWILLYFLLPVIEGYMLIGIANYLGETDRFSYFGSFLKKGAEQILKWSVGLVAGLNLIQNMILPAYDSVKSGLWQKGLSAIPGAGPVISAVTGSLIGSGVLLKNCIGAGGVIFLILLCAVPFLKIMILSLSFSLCAVLLQPISDKRLIQLFHTAAQSGWLFLQVIICCCTLFFLTMALTALSTNLRYYIM